jgi:hypothetical protein
MDLPVPNANTDFLPPPAGTFSAVCYRFLDLGTQDTTFQGKPKQQHKVLIGWEVDEKMDDGRPFTISNRYTWSMSEKANLRKDLESWRGLAFKESDFGPGGFNVKRLLGAPCMLTVVHTEKDGKTYANIRAISKLPKGMTPLHQENPLTFLSLEPEEFDRAIYDALSDGLKQMIAKSPEYQRIANGGHVSDQTDSGAGRGGHDLDDDIPF